MAWASNLAEDGDIQQYQRNLGVVVGTNNKMDQENDADASIAAAASGSSIFQSQKNMAVELGVGRRRVHNDLDQRNYAEAYITIGDSKVDQIASNLALMIGMGQDSYQRNRQYADTPDGSSDIDQFAANNLLMIGHFDEATQINNQDADGVKVDQNAANLGLLLSGQRQRGPVA